MFCIASKERKQIRSGDWSPSNDCLLSFFPSFFFSFLPSLFLSFFLSIFLSFFLSFFLYLSDRIEEDKDEIDEIAEPEHCLVDIERIVHVSVHETRSVHKGHQGELLLLRGRNLRRDVVHHS